MNASVSTNSKFILSFNDLPMVFFPTLLIPIKMIFVIYLILNHVGVFHFFFSSRRRHTRSLRDWSSDVCSSDLMNAFATLTTIAFVPQVMRAWRTRSSRDISLWAFVIFSIGVSLWLVYGILIDSWPDRKSVV